MAVPTTDSDLGALTAESATHIQVNDVDLRHRVLGVWPPKCLKASTRTFTAVDDSKANPPLSPPGLLQTPGALIQVSRPSHL